MILSVGHYCGVLQYSTHISFSQTDGNTIHFTAHICSFGLHYEILTNLEKAYGSTTFRTCCFRVTTLWTENLWTWRDKLPDPQHTSLMISLSVKMLVLKAKDYFYRWNVYKNHQIAGCVPESSLLSSCCPCTWIWWNSNASNLRVLLNPKFQLPEITLRSRFTLHSNLILFCVEYDKLGSVDCFSCSQLSLCNICFAFRVLSLPFNLKLKMC